MSNGEKKQPAKALTIYGTAEQIQQYGERAKHVLPGGDKLDAFDAVLAMDYARAIDANPFRGEVYAYKNKQGKLILVESYKLLVRWARRQSDFFDVEEELSDEEKVSLGLDPKEDIAWRVWVLREDKLGALERTALLLHKLNDPDPYGRARREIAQCGTGVVTLKDRTTSRGDPQDPPVGWTWDDVAKKRALKNALNKAYGVPSPREIADESWKVGDVQTKAEDWQVVDEHLPEGTNEERALLAAAIALDRQRMAEFDALSPEAQRARLEENTEGLGRPPAGFEGFDTPPEEETREPPPETGYQNGDTPDISGWSAEDVHGPADDPPPEGQAVEVPRGGHTPEVIRRTCRYHARWTKGQDPDWADAYRPDPPPSDPIPDDLLRNVAAALNNAIGKGTAKQRDDKRHAVYRYLFNVDSGAKLTMKEGQAILRWIALPDAQKIGEIKAMAPAEVQAVVKAAELAAGQQMLPGV